MLACGRKPTIQRVSKRLAMLIVCNGVYKSGSTWIFTMLVDLIDQKELPEDWEAARHPRNINLFHDPQGIFDAARELHLVAKIHSYDRDWLRFLIDKGARVVVTRRSRVDTLLSHYHHFSNEKFRLPFVLYAMTIGLLKSIEIVLYESVATQPEFAHCVIAYEDMRTDPRAALMTVVEKLGIGATEERISTVAIEANMRSRAFAEKFPGREDRDWFFRRDRKATTAVQRSLAGIAVKVAEALIGVGLLRRAAYWVAMRDPRRNQSSFARER
ncbi:sulfotransferase domain-containing protein [Lentisalinibacter sediminis]|uniref:sulfotransferase domain-containing protein n=1 Tax=Lentisalinibacter sediminis TaxID=2992237 RepID=UPI0038675C02